MLELVFKYVWRLLNIIAIIVVIMVLALFSKKMLLSLFDRSAWCELDLSGYLRNGK